MQVAIARGGGGTKPARPRGLSGDNPVTLQSTIALGRQSEPVYDYLLVVGPGRSGSEFLYRLLRDHPGFVFPEIKERYYYRSPRAFRRARKRLDGRQGQILCDVANLAYADARLSRGVEALREEGCQDIAGGASQRPSGPRDFDDTVPQKPGGAFSALGRAAGGGGGCTR